MYSGFVWVIIRTLKFKKGLGMKKQTGVRKERAQKRIRQSREIINAHKRKTPLFTNPYTINGSVIYCNILVKRKTIRKEVSYARRTFLSKTSNKVLPQRAR